jgi:hypothetical protein
MNMTEGLNFPTATPDLSSEEFSLEGLDFSPRNSWLQLVVNSSPKANDPNRPAKKRGTTPIYTYHHPMVTQARALKESGMIDLHISRVLKVDPKTVHRWKMKGFLKTIPGADAA